MMVRYALVGHESIGPGGIDWGEVGSSAFACARQR
jgi:hypothetical protein